MTDLSPDAREAAAGHAPGGPPPAPPAPSRHDLERLLPAYAAPDGHFDELLAAPPDADAIATSAADTPASAATAGAAGRATREPRPHWAAFADHAGNLTPAALSRAQARVARQMHENGITYNVYASSAHGGPARPWALDVLPQIVPADEWTRLDDALRQRARLLNAVAADLYGHQRLLAEGFLPPALVWGHPGFLRACHGVRPPGGVFLHVIAFDLARGPDGAWRAIDTRCQAPSGAGYALENRLAISRLFPDAFRELHVARLAPFFRTLQDTLLAAAPHGGAAPHVVLLTPGPFNETYFEHAYLARYLGFTLAEGGDLTVRDEAVYLKTVSGLRPVHAILRRLDDAFCDPLELRADSTLGVPGLVQAWRAGRVLVANAFGAGVLESPALRSFLPAICQRLLDEPLQLASPQTWWGGEPAALDAALPRLADMVIKRAFPGARLDRVVAGALEAARRSAWIERLQATPAQFVLEEYLPLSHTPVWQDDRLDSRALMLRAFLVSDGQGDYHVMPGGLSRIAPRAGGQIVSGQRGGSSKDTWVLSDGPVERVTLLPAAGAAGVGGGAGAGGGRAPFGGERLISSRSAENLFWLGRYAERSENSARLLRAVLSRLHEGDALLAPGADVRPIAQTCYRHGLLRQPERRAHVRAYEHAHDIERALIDGLFDAATHQSLAFNIQQTVRTGGAVRDRLSSDNWRVLNQLSQAFAMPPASTPAQASTAGLAEALELLDETILSLVAVGGLEMAHMTRDDGWRFLSLGRHLERLLYVVTTVAEVAAAERQALEDEPALLDWLLDLSDSLITYRARYMRQPEWLAVVELLLFDPRNPRAAAFQLAKIAKHARLLPEADLGELVDALERAGATHVADPSQGELFVPQDDLGGFLRSCEQLALRLSDALTLRYFSHVYEHAHATALI